MSRPFASITDVTRFKDLIRYLLTQTVTDASTLGGHAASDFLQVSNNLSDVANTTSARTSLGLGNSATRAVGTTAGTVAEGDDSRFTSIATAASSAQATANSAQADATTALAVVSNLPLEYKITLTQTGSSDPTVDNTFVNTLGETPTFARGGVGQYRLNTLSSLFVDGKVFPIGVGTGSYMVPLYGVSNLIVGSMRIVISLGTRLQINTYNLTGIASDDLLTEQPISIKIYP